MIAYTAQALALTTGNGDKYLFREGHSPSNYVILLADQEGRVRISPEDIETIVNLVVERLKAPEVKHTPRDTSE